MRFNKLFRKVFAAVSAVTLIVSGMPVGLGVTAFAADTQGCYNCRCLNDWLPIEFH